MSILKKVSLPSLSEKDILHKTLCIALANKQQIAMWRLPGHLTRHLIISNQARVLPTDYVLEELPAGFIFAPFNRQKGSIFLEADRVFSFEEGTLREPETPAEISSATWLAQQETTPAETQETPCNPGGPSKSYTEKGHAEYMALVEKCLREISREHFEKVVPSRTKSVTLPDNFDVADVFQKLCQTYPEALVSFVHIPGTGTWMGASPETLVSVENRAIFRTVALAGTQPYLPGTNLKSVAWTQKEIEEQALVERYVISCFKRIRLREYEEHGPKTVVAGNLMHLKSDFTVDMKATGFPQLGSVMLQLLHPTSAVCGVPLDASLAFLGTNEGYDREFYAGYLGPVNFNNDIHLFVNLRCMQVFADKAVLYAGAGVTCDSLPQKEWEETEIKLSTLLKVIR